jgi:hypothetical protein
MIDEEEAIRIATAHGVANGLPSFEPLFAKVDDAQSPGQRWKVHLQFNDLNEEPGFTVVFVDIVSGEASLLCTL